MKPKYPIKAFDGTNTTDVQVLNVPAESVGENGEVNLNAGVKVYRALLTQSGTDAPVATVLENTLGGTVAWSYGDVGIYLATLSVPILTADKTCLPSVNASASMEGAPVVVTAFYRTDTDVVRLQTAFADLSGGSLTLTDGLLADSYVQIIVYP